jgi:hypothetical protein
MPDGAKSNTTVTYSKGFVVRQALRTVCFRFEQGFMIGMMRARTLVKKLHPLA